MITLPVCSFRRLCAILLALLTIPASGAVVSTAAQSEAELRQRAADVVAVIAGEKPYAEVFADSFVMAVPEAQFAMIGRQLTAQVGALVGLDAVEPGAQRGAATVSIRFERAIVRGPMQLEGTAPYRVAGLLLNDLAPVNDRGLSMEEQLRELRGDTAMLFARLDGSEVIAAHNADQQFAVGSTFKLYVLSALSRSIARGERRWHDVVELTERSFPSGQMQDWPRGSPVTLHTLATMMISISDNTATDQLMAVLGREAVEAELVESGHSAPAATLPYLTTRELFLLKLGEDAALARYEAADEAERRAILAGLQDRQLDMADIQRVFASGPRFIGVEWFASAQDIARIYARLVEVPVALDILGVNLGMDRQRFSGWNYAGYKGGSEPGVLNFSWLLRDDAGAWWVLAMSWNNPAAPVSEMEFLALAQAALAERERR
ncbi:serine hydrolase [Altererythrobacter lauratis]|uniref:Serine hydrolase n=1 Tax=Alteraurantiacibacter lauratis TaxID=2054627 RepID=A0ABV7E9R6_9SPHN